MRIGSLFRHGRVLGVLVSLVLLAGTAQAQFSLLHEFAGGGSDGRGPYGWLTLSGSTLYGMTYGGGDSELGTVFSYSLAPIPEPSTVLLLGAGLGLPTMRRRRVKSSS